MIVIKEQEPKFQYPLLICPCFRLELKNGFVRVWTPTDNINRVKFVKLQGESKTLTFRGLQPESNYQTGVIATFPVENPNGKVTQAPKAHQSVSRFYVGRDTVVNIELKLENRALFQFDENSEIVTGEYFLNISDSGQSLDAKYGTERFQYDDGQPLTPTGSVEINSNSIERSFELSETEEDTVWVKFRMQPSNFSQWTTEDQTFSSNYFPSYGSCSYDVPINTSKTGTINLGEVLTSSKVRNCQSN